MARPLRIEFGGALYQWPIAVTPKKASVLEGYPQKAKTSTEKPLTYFAERYKNYNKSMAHAYLSDR